jgi:hypothetical protein
MRHDALYDPKQRAAEKEASRAADARALATGEKSREQLWRENGHFAFTNSRLVFGDNERLY